MELLERGEVERLLVLDYIKGKERLVVHNVRRVDIAEKIVGAAVCENSKAAPVGGKIAIKLPLLLFLELKPCAFGFYKHNRLAVVQYNVVDFLALFSRNIANVLRHYLLRVEHIIPQKHKKRHDKRVFRCFFSHGIELAGVLHYSVFVCVKIICKHSGSSFTLLFIYLRIYHILRVLSRVFQNFL